MGGLTIIHGNAHPTNEILFSSPDSGFFWEAPFQLPLASLISYLQVVVYITTTVLPLNSQYGGPLTPEQLIYLSSLFEIVP